ncbi:anion exchange [Pseudozyma hubeiensis SY62]|uniref:Anion exchange n=1 Tax=Pseudozyma hubeiensis (strain SY62) TaxID=1305764 RepID=R9P303_PSEHS|nr:anion exchange [Pseudozyma hubeiensis SY62]GAC95684.1 anion exchange [Pseudozyma hubeiensis SY62]
MFDVAEEGVDNYVLWTSEEEFKYGLMQAVTDALSTPSTKLSLVPCAKRGPYWEPSEPESNRGIVVYGVLLISPALDTGCADFDFIVETIAPTASSCEIPQRLESHGLWWTPVPQ